MQGASQPPGPSSVRGLTARAARWPETDPLTSRCCSPSEAILFAPGLPSLVSRIPAPRRPLLQAVSINLNFRDHETVVWRRRGMAQALCVAGMVLGEKGRAEGLRHPQQRRWSDLQARVSRVILSSCSRRQLITVSLLLQGGSGSFPPRKLLPARL